jgi:hypothetical protein
VATHDRTLLAGAAATRCAHSISSMVRNARKRQRWQSRRDFLEQVLESHRVGAQRSSSSHPHKPPSLACTARQHASGAAKKLPNTMQVRAMSCRVAVSAWSSLLVFQVSAAHAAHSTDAALCALRSAQLRIAPAALRTAPQRLSRSHNSGAAPQRRASSAAKKTSTSTGGGLVVASLADPHEERHIHVYAPLAPPPEETDIELGRFVANVRSPRFGC